MMLNPDITKQAQEVIISQKIVNHFHHSPSPPFIFNQVPVKCNTSQKCLRLHLHQKEFNNKAQKGLLVLKKSL